MNSKLIRVCRVILLSVVCVLQSAALPKVVYLVTMPRSLSTVFVRMMHARQDFTIINEPGTLTYLHVSQCAKTSVTYFGDVLEEFGAVQEAIASKTHGNLPVFVKEFAFSACNYLGLDSHFLNQQDYYTMFLIRNPHKSLISYHKKLPPELQSKVVDFMDYKKLYELYMNFKATSPRKPLIVRAEDLMSNPRKTVAQVCAYIDVPFKEENLSWQKLDDSFCIADEWNCDIPAEAAYYWYGPVMDSTGFKQETSTYSVNDQGDPTFEEIENAELRALYKNTYIENMPYYLLLLQEYAQQQSSLCN